MALASRYLIDTSVLLRISRKSDPLHLDTRSALGSLEKHRSEACFSLQNIAEFWNVCTRPKQQNRYGLSIAETDDRVETIESSMTFLPDSFEAYSLWRRLVTANNVHGVQVHDACLAALMERHGITHILTLNGSDFRRYPHIQAIHPSQLQC
jgi:predicted nucleic acid-binding protein